MSRVYRVSNGTQKMIDCRKVAKHYGYMIKATDDIKEGYRVYQVINKQNKELLLEGDLNYMYGKLWSSEYDETMKENLKLLEQAK